MTPLKPTHAFTLTLCLLVAIGCSSHIDLATETGGTGNGLPTGGWGPYSGGTSPVGGFGGAPSGGSIGTGGSACCNQLPTCDVADYVVSSSDATACLPGGGLSCYSRTSCCTTVTCGTRWATGSGGTSWGTGGNPGVPTGGMEATGGAVWDATGGNAPTYPKANCTYGMDQTCNDSSIASTVFAQCGQCQVDGYCTCIGGYYPSPSTGKCTTLGQTVCYSPTQNIDKAYVDRAFGCNCYSTIDKPWCGIDSSGLRVYLSCISNMWQSGDTSACN